MKTHVNCPKNRLPFLGTVPVQAVMFTVTVTVSPYPQVGKHTRGAALKVTPLSVLPSKYVLLLSKYVLMLSPLQARRFAATLGELTGGRVGLTCGSAGVLKGAITIAIRYSAGRQQFGPPESPEVSNRV